MTWDSQRRRWRALWVVVVAAGAGLTPPVDPALSASRADGISGDARLDLGHPLPPAVVARAAAAELRERVDRDGAEAHRRLEHTSRIEPQSQLTRAPDPLAMSAAAQGALAWRRRAAARSAEAPAVPWHTVRGPPPQTC